MARAVVAAGLLLALPMVVSGAARAQTPAAAPVQPSLQGPAQAVTLGGKLEAKYEASLAGIAVGKGQWAIDINDDQYSATASGGTAGLLKAFAGGSGSGQSIGRVVGGALVPSNYQAVTTSVKKSETIRMLITPGYVKEYSIEPEPPADPEKIPITDAHRRNVIDPMTGSLLRVAGTGELLTPDSCRTGTSIFDGRMRYDLKLDYKRMENVKAEKGYHGPAIVCAVYFTPIAGYVPDRAAIKYLAAQRNIEVTLVPIAGTRVLVPYRMTVPTPLGVAMLEATEFVTSAAPPKAVAKTN
ncbi:DUF3108 domain-containing protein [Bradyrhizobium sp. NFR13]|uniref:DUF3108 domain-containing protein n=1 Tax=Bradyrhizobium sp. NFR13 TaxID=1566285 RepID=UPI0025707E45|nr:DUF3108 domain-containing protein [Bradyrhizobium sp. NFR13]